MVLVVDCATLFALAEKTSSCKTLLISHLRAELTERKQRVARYCGTIGGLPRSYLSLHRLLQTPLSPCQQHASSELALISMPTGTLLIGVEEGHHLEDRGFVTKQNTLCQVTVGNNTYKTDAARHGGSNPIWEERC